MKKRKHSIGRAVVHFFLIVLSLACLIPFLLVLAVSLTSEQGVQVNGYNLIPSEFSLEAYEFLFRTPAEILRAYGVTIFVTLFGTAVSTLISAMIAYPLSRPDYKYRRIASFYIYFTMLFSGGLVPSYLLVSNYLQLRDTVWALILPILLSGWNVFLLRVFFSGIPMPLIEAASIEGAGEFRIFFTIVCPLSKVGIVTIALFYALNYWNDWYQSMLYMQRGNLKSLQYLLYRVMNQVELAKEWGGGVTQYVERLPGENLRMALCVIAAGPMLFVFPFFQRFFSKGVVVGGVKG